MDTTSSMTPVRKIAFAVSLPPGALNLWLAVPAFPAWHRIPKGPIPLIFLFTYVSAITNGIIIVELLRSGKAIPSSASWNDEKHFKIVAAIAVLLFLVQTLSMFAIRVYCP